MCFAQSRAAALAGLVAAFGAAEPLAAQVYPLVSQERTLTVDGLSRMYLLMAPRRRDGEPRPLVLVLHGGGGGARQMERHSGFNAVARKEGALICYPQGIDGSWNDGRDVALIAAQRLEIDDVKFLRAVIEAVSSEQDVAPGRVFVTGISNGAFMSYRLAADAADVVAGIAPVAGGMGESVAADFSPSHPVSLFVIHGDADPLVPLEGGEVGFQRGRKRGKFIATQAAIEKCLKINGIRQSPQSAPLPDVNPEDETTTVAQRYPAGRGGARVQFYLVKNGGHTWPGRRLPLTERVVGKVSRDFEAEEAIWEFFKSCPARSK